MQWGGRVRGRRTYLYILLKGIVRVICIINRWKMISSLLPEKHIIRITLKPMRTLQCQIHLYFFLTCIPLDHFKIYANYSTVLLCIIVNLKLKGLPFWQLQEEFKQKTKVYPTEDPNYGNDQLYTDLI